MARRERGEAEAKEKTQRNGQQPGGRGYTTTTTDVQPPPQT